jgi:hypothetical protein
MNIYSEMTELALVPAQTRGAGRDKRVTSAAQPDCPGDEVFAQALRDDSNQELDWLWAYVQVTREDQRCYCLERALAINPKSEIAQRELIQLRAGR